MHIFGRWGLYTFGAALLSIVALVLMKIYWAFDITGNPFLYITILFFLVGVQLISMGLIAEISIRTYHESQGRPIYTIRKILK